MNKDTIIGIVGAAVLVAAMVAVFQYEEAVAARGNDTVASAITAVAGPALEGTTELGAVTEETVNVTRLGLTNVSFFLNWTAQNGADTLTITVVPPEGVAEPMTVSGDTGTIELGFAIANTDPSGALGAGDWQVSVQFTSASGAGPSQVPVPVAPDSEVTWTLETLLEGYEATSA